MTYGIKGLGLNCRINRSVIYHSVLSCKGYLGTPLVSCSNFFLDALRCIRLVTVACSSFLELLFVLFCFCSVFLGEEERGVRVVGAEWEGLGEGKSGNTLDFKFNSVKDVLLFYQTLLCCS